MVTLPPCDPSPWRLLSSHVGVNPPVVGLLLVLPPPPTA
jgi:hypothetical protein